jgi:hypothetical protein
LKINGYLLSLRDIGRISPNEMASRYVESLEIKVIHHFYQLTDPLTVREFWRRVAMLGGFLGRKSDGEPGWQTLWIGWLRLQDMCRGIKLVVENI